MVRRAPLLPFAIGGWRGVRDPQFPEASLAPCLGPGEPGVTVKRTARKTVGRVPGRPPVALTRYSLASPPARWVRRSRSRRAFDAARRLIALELPAAPPLFAARGGAEERLGVAWIEGAKTLAEAVRDGAPSAPLSATLARGLARAHAAGIRLRDLKAENFLVAPDGRLRFVDFDGVLPLRARSKAAGDLSRLDASFEPGGPVGEFARLRFLAHYLRERARRGRPVRDPRAFARAILRRGQERRRRWARLASSSRAR